MSSQQKLFSKPRAEKKSHAVVSADHDVNNLRAAKEMLQDPEHWGGEQSGMIRWARTVVARLEPPSK